MVKAAGGSTGSPESGLPIPNQISILRLEIQGMEKELAAKRSRLALLEKLNR